MQDVRLLEENINIRTNKESLIQNCNNIQTCGGPGATPKIKTQSLGPFFSACFDGLTKKR